METKSSINCNGYIEDKGDVLDGSQQDGENSHTILLSLEENCGLNQALRAIVESGVIVLNIESRRGRILGERFDIKLEVAGSLITVMNACNMMRESPYVQAVQTVGEADPEREDIWYPKHISDLDKCIDVMVKLTPDFDAEHPGFKDTDYINSRGKFAKIAAEFRQGQPIPRVVYSEYDTQTWCKVYRRLQELYPTHACRVHRHNLQMLERECGYSPDYIPQLEDVSNFLKRKTGFQLRPVSGLLTSRDFLASLAFRVFQCTQYIRHPAKPEQSSEPDCIHELLGHVPMFADPVFADFCQDIGLWSLGVSDSDIDKLATLFWFTIEIGLCKEEDGVRAFGAAIMSAYGELTYALSGLSQIRPFDVEEASVQQFEVENMQPLYYVIESFPDMMYKLRNFARNLHRPYDLSYDPLNQTIRQVNMSGTIHHVFSKLKQETKNLEYLIHKLPL